MGARPRVGWRWQDRPAAYWLAPQRATRNANMGGVLQFLSGSQGGAVAERRAIDEALVHAVGTRDLGAVSRLLRGGANPSATDTFGRSCILMAAHRDDLAMARVLVAAGACVNARDCQGDTPLFWTCHSDGTAFCRFLLSAGADVNMDVYGWTPLHFAARRGRQDCVLELVAAGADVGARTREGDTAADVAARNGQPATALLLLDMAAAAIRWRGIRRLALLTWCGQ